MKNKIVKIFAILALLLSLTGIVSILHTGIASAAKKTTTASSNVCDTDAAIEVKEAAGCPETGSNSDAVKVIVTNILNAIIGVSGLVAAIFIVVGSIQYMTSTGDSGKVEKAKKTILYALIGLVVCTLAFAIVNWTIGALDSTTTTSEESESESNDKQNKSDTSKKSN